MKPLLIYIFSTFLFLSLLNADSPDLFDMSMEEILNLPIRSGTMTGATRIATPVMLTVIDRADIQMTPARNLLDILEVYVPGFTFVEHYRGPRLGLRGVLSDQNYSYLLLVNNKNMGVKYSNGLLMEFTNKDLNDIERIEVIRGPGSVIYGPGAIAGVINIITKPDQQAYGQSGVAGNAQYRMESCWMQLQTGDATPKTSVYASLTRSQGLRDTRFWYIDRAHGYGYGFMSPNWGDQCLGDNASDYLGDYLEEPEVKVQVISELPYNIESWFRYTTTSQRFMTQASASAEGEAWSGLMHKQFTGQLKHTQKWSDAWELETQLGYKTTNIREIGLWQREALPIDHIAQWANSFSEHEWNLRALLLYTFSDKLKLAFGGEYQYEYFAPEWGMDDEDFLLSLPAPVRFAVLTEDSDFHQYYDGAFSTVIDEKIDGSMQSVFTEVNWDIHRKLQVIASARLDKHEFSETAFSPRLAVISPLDERHIFKLTAQQSVRIPLFADLYVDDYSDGDTSEFEKLKSVELSYQQVMNENLTVLTTCYYNELDQFAWIPEDTATGLYGSFDHLGFELEAGYHRESLHAGLAYSFIDQLSWEPEVTDSAWIAGLDGEVIYLEDNAENRINNLPGHMLKGFGRCNISSQLQLHLDGRLYWDYQQNDMLDQFEEAHEKYGNPETLAYMRQIRDDLESHGYGRPSFTSNLALRWLTGVAGRDVVCTLYCNNILQYNHIRYIIQYWETGNLRQYPRQCGFIEEPLSVGVKLTMHF